MGRISFYLLTALFSASTWAQIYCDHRPNHTWRVLQPAVALVAQSQEFAGVFKKYPDADFCTSGIVLEYRERANEDVLVLEIVARSTKKMATLEHFRVLVDGQKISVLPFKESTAVLREWVGALTYKSAGVLPAVEGHELAVRLNVFTSAKSDERTVTSLNLSFPRTPSEIYSVVTWSTDVLGNSAVSERVGGAVIVQDRLTGDVAVADRMNLSTLIESLRKLAR